MALLKADLHVHSYFSQDSILKPHDIVRIARRRGVNCVAVTDHNTVKGGLKLIEIAKAFDDFIAIPGVELKTERGDLALLFVYEEVKIKSFVEALDFARSIDAITVLVHPFRSHIMIEDSAMNVHAIEALNARSDRAANLKARQLALKLGKTMTAGSDAHTTIEVGKAFTIVEGSSEEDVRRCLLEGKTSIFGSESTPVVHFLSFASKILKKISRTV